MCRPVSVKQPHWAVKIRETRLFEHTTSKMSKEASVKISFGLRTAVISGLKNIYKQTTIVFNMLLNAHPTIILPS